MSLFARAPMAIDRSSQVGTAWPATRTIRSPGLMPLRSAGDPFSTAPITAARSRNAGTRAPCISTIHISTSASRMFITGPMIRTWNRSHLVFERNSSGWPVRGSSGVSPAIFT